MAEVVDGTYTLVEPVIMAFPALFEPKAFNNPKTGQPVGEPKYGASFVFEPSSADLKGLKTLAAKVARAKWPGREFNTLLFPFRDGTKQADDRQAKGKADGEWQRGKVIVSARSKFPPRLSAIENGRLVEFESPEQRALVKHKFYPGVLACAQFNLVTHEVGSNTPGVTAYLQMVFSTGKGERIGGKPAAEVFKAYVGQLSTEDPTVGQVVEDDIAGL